jgi:hypothetical protein
MAWRLGSLGIPRLRHAVASAQRVEAIDQAIRRIRGAAAENAGACPLRAVAVVLRSGGTGQTRLHGRRTAAGPRIASLDLA